jgi:hypothetical protein
MAAKPGLLNLGTSDHLAITVDQPTKLVETYTNKNHSIDTGLG